MKKEQNLNSIFIPVCLFLSHWAMKYGWTIIEALTDEALTGRKKNNPMNTNQPDKNDDRPISLPNAAPSAWLKRPGDHRTDQPVAPGSFPPFENLKDAGLIDVHREGTCNYYYLSIETAPGN